MSQKFQVSIDSISPEMHARMRGASWHEHPECPAPEQLAVLRMTHWGMDARSHRGELVVARSVAEEVVSVFRSIFATGFPIEEMAPVHVFQGDDRASMAANNCSGFNFRTVAGTDQLSQHAFGLAIDINPVHNPWVRGDKVLPAAGQEYLDRNHVRLGMIVRPDPVTDAFDAIGWTWGGDWPDVQDYHHFQKHPRE